MLNMRLSQAPLWVTAWPHVTKAPHTPLTSRTLRTYQPREINAVADSLEKALGDDESAGQLLPRLLLRHPSHDTFQIIHVSVVVPFDVAPGDLQASAYGEVDGAIGNDDVASLAEGGYDTGDGGESLGVNNASLGANVRRDVSLRLHVYILGAVKLRRPAGTNTVGA